MRKTLKMIGRQPEWFVFLGTVSACCLSSAGPAAVGWVRGVCLNDVIGVRRYGIEERVAAEHHRLPVGVVPNQYGHTARRMSRELVYADKPVFRTVEIERSVGCDGAVDVE